MSKQKYCSLINYVKSKNKPLYEFIDDVCARGILNPRKNGVTLLMPDAKLTKELVNQEKNNPEEAVNLFKACVILDNVESLTDFTNKNINIPNALMKKVESGTLSSGKVKLSNGSIISVDPKFKYRNDRKNMNVFILSNKLLPTDGESTSLNPPKKVKGGREVAANKIKLTEKMMDDLYNTDKPSMPHLPALVSYFDWLGKKDNDDEKKKCNDLCTLLDPNPIVSWYILMRPYSSMSDLYVSEDNFSKWQYETMGYCKSDNPNADYTKLMDQKVDHSLADFNSVQKKLNQEKGFKPLLAKATNLLLEKLCQDKKQLDSMVGKTRANVYFKDYKILEAEGEFRLVMGQRFDGVLNDLESKVVPTYSKDGLNHELKHKYNLNEPYICFDNDMMSKGNGALFYSTVSSLILSDALVYHSNNKGTYPIDDYLDNGGESDNLLKNNDGKASNSYWANKCQSNHSAMVSALQKVFSVQPQQQQ